MNMTYGSSTVSFVFFCSYNLWFQNSLQLRGKALLKTPNFATQKFTFQLGIPHQNGIDQ